MARTFLLTVGTSVFTNLGRKYHDHFGSFGEDVKAIGRALELHDDAACSAYWQTNVRPLLERRGWGPSESSVPADISVEVESLIGTDPHPELGDLTVRGQDAIVLLASDTTDGVLAAFMVAERLRGGFEYRAEPSRIAAVGQRPLVVRIPQLDAGEPATFGHALAHVAEAMARTARAADTLAGADRPAQLIVHIGGGFKATLPSLYLLGQFLRSMANLDVRVLVKFESTSQVIDVPIPVLHQGWIDEIKRVENGAHPYTATLEGVAYSDGRLNDFGRSIARLAATYDAYHGAA